MLDELGSDTISHDYFLQSSFQKEAIDQWNGTNRCLDKMQDQAIKARRIRLQVRIESSSPKWELYE